MVYKDGNRYEGEFRDRQVNGQGKLTMTSGDVYVGHFTDSQLAGVGTMSFADGG